MKFFIFIMLFLIIVTTVNAEVIRTIKGTCSESGKGIIDITLNQTGARVNWGVEELLDRDWIIHSSDYLETKMSEEKKSITFFRVAKENVVSYKLEVPLNTISFIDGDYVLDNGRKKKVLGDSDFIVHPNGCSEVVNGFYKGDVKAKHVIIAFVLFLIFIIGLIYFVKRNK